MAGARADTHQQRRYGVLAGSGRIPVDLCFYLRAQGDEPVVFMLKGDADDALRQFHHYEFTTTQIGSLVKAGKREGVTHIVMVGGVHSRPALRDFRPDWFTLRLMPRVVKALRLGDDAILGQVIGGLEESGFGVLGVHELMPDIVAEAGALGRAKPSRAVMASIDIGRRAALLLGEVDAGQGVIVIGKRIVALEGAEGTDAMLQRVAALKQNGRLHNRKAGVLVKLAKPGQELRADMPTIGLKTVENAAAAQLAGIAVDGGRTLIVDRAAVLAAADQAGLFIFGLEST